MSRNPRENLILGGFICIAFGAFFTVAGIYTLASTVGVGGILLFIVGMSLKSNIGLSEDDVRNWRPSEGQLPDAGRVMYRVDVTIDEPIESTIVCGPCGKVTVFPGPKPTSFICQHCNVELWNTEEE
tara:strand:+ start:8486 stop:8866 length:381 start_codon:yes stop_codon:yes gene_type:complete